MAIAVVMPRQGQSVETCVITQWHKAKGDQINEGDILFSYETDKAAFDGEANGSGTLIDIFFEEGDEVPVLTNIAVIGQTGDNYDDLIPENAQRSSASEPSPAGTESQSETSSDAKPAAGAEPGSETTPSPGTETPIAAAESEHSHQAATNDSGGRLRASPLARRIAKEYNIALAGITGSGPLGRIIERDVKAAMQKSKKATPTTQQPAETRQAQAQPVTQASPQPKPSVSVTHAEGSYADSKLSNIRKIIASRMHASLQNSAQLTHHISADARKLLAIRKDVKGNAGSPGAVDITINDMVCFAVINALKKHPGANAHFLGDQIRTFNKVHLGFAVDTDRGLMVPALKDADDLNLAGLATRLKTLANECKQGSIDPQLLASEEASFTISNLGAFGIELFTPVLNLPQVGILGVNTITYKPADIGGGTIGFIPMIGLSLTYDHRAIDGAPASRFLKEIKDQIENLSYEV